MGASSFITDATGDTAQAAFSKAVHAACHEHGHGGYTGTIAEKTEFTEIPLPPGADPWAHARELIDADDGRIADKWGPAGCFDLKGGDWLFFGWASD